MSLSVSVFPFLSLLLQYQLMQHAEEQTVEMNKIIIY